MTVALAVFAGPAVFFWLDEAFEQMARQAARSAALWLRCLGIFVICF